MTETLHTGDNLEYMQTLPSESIDLIYSDILYGTGRDFGDYKDIKANRKDVEAFYIPRIKEMHRLLKSTGSIYLQMDTTINHIVRLLLDEVFGANNFVNEIIWCYKTTLRPNKHKFGRDHDHIIFYSKSGNYTYNVDRTEFMPSKSTLQRYGKYADENGFVSAEYIKPGKNTILNKNTGFYINNGMPIDWWEISHITGGKRDETKNGKYATQKPLALMERIIKASSNIGDVCADFFAGSGSFGVAAKKLNRNVILNDINPEAIKLCRRRLKDASDLFNYG